MTTFALTFSAATHCGGYGAGGTCIYLKKGGDQANKRHNDAHQLTIHASRKIHRADSVTLTY